MSERSPRLSRKFRRGMAAGLLTAGAAAGAVGHSVVDGIRDRGNLPACEFDATQYGVNSPASAIEKLTAAGADTGDMEVRIYAADGHQRTAMTDQVIKDSVVTQVGDRVEVLRVDPQICIATAGQVAVEQVANPKMPSDHMAQQ